MDSIETLLERFIDDRDTLSDGELDVLVAEAKENTSIAQMLKDQLVVDELLGQQLALDRRDFVAQVAQRIRDDVSGTNEGTSENQVTQQMRDLLDVELSRHQHEAQRRQSSSWRWAAALSLLIILAAVGGWWWQNNSRPVALVEQVTGTPTLVRGSKSIPVAVGMPLRAGDALTTLPDHEISIRYADGTELTLLGDTSVSFLAEDGTHGKRAEISWGTVSAEVVPQQVGRPMRLITPLSIATVVGTRLWLSADDERTRLDVIEGVVDLQRISDNRSMPVRTREFAVATEEEFVIETLSWPVDRRDAILMLDTVDGLNQVQIESGQYVPIDLRPRGHARQDHSFALIVSDGSYNFFNASAGILERCQRTNELSIEATITPRYASQSSQTCIIGCSAGRNDLNFELGQSGDRLTLRLRTDAGETKVEVIELCRLTANRQQHVLVAYRSGELVCYLDGRRVFQDARIRGGFSNWERFAVNVGDNQRHQQDWDGQIESIAIYDRFVSDEEAQRNAQLYRDAVARRPAIPQVEIKGTLLEKSPVPQPADVLPSPMALVVCRYRVDGVIRGELAQSEVFVAQWAVLGGQPQSVAEMQVGSQREMTIERLGVNAQLEGIPRIDIFSDGDEPTKPRFFEVSDP